MDEDNQDAFCQLCRKAAFKYVCPRCNIPYCSVQCYQSPSHLDCSEAFYKDNVQEWIKSEGPDSESRRKMMEMLKRFEDQDAEGGDILEDEIEDSDDEGSLTERLAEVDLDDADQVWDRLLPEEKQEFLDLVKKGDVSALIPEWQPWWVTKYPTPKVRFLDEPYELEYKSLCPQLCPTPDFSTLTKTEPSPQVYFNVINVLAAYCATCRYLNGDLQSLPAEAASMLVHISKNLMANETFSDMNIAVESVNQSVIDCSWITFGADSHLSELLIADVSCLLEGPNDEDRLYYVKAALSDALVLLKAAKNANKMPKQGKFSLAFPDSSPEALPLLSRNVITKCSKKLEFYLSWTDRYLSVYAKSS